MMKLYSVSGDIYSHVCRIIMFEKGMDFEVVNASPDFKPEEMRGYSFTFPVLVERDLVINGANIIYDYIDERFPRPQLMPADPVTRARARLFLRDFENHLFVHIPALEACRVTDEARKEIARKHVRDNLLLIVPIFSKQQYLLSDEFSMVDVVLAPLLWRLDYYGIHLPDEAASLLKYADQIFTRPTFYDAMTSSEIAMKDPAIVKRYQFMGQERAKEEQLKWQAIIDKTEANFEKQKRSNLKTKAKKIKTLKIKPKNIKTGIEKLKTKIRSTVSKVKKR
jgi:stringent starvation protein A